MLILAIDPGPTKSGWALYDTGTREVQAGVYDNPSLRHALETIWRPGVSAAPSVLAIEKVECYGMAVGASVFETVMWVGRLLEIAGIPARLVPRRAVKLHMCNSARAKDANVVAAVADRYGGSLKAAKGTKNAPGPLYGISGDAWQALALAITVAETQEEGVK